MQFDPDGPMWRDPPLYWEHIVWPAYVKAHSHLFINSNIETGLLKPEVEEKIKMLGATQMTMVELLDATCTAILEFIAPGSLEQGQNESAECSGHFDETFDK